ncbi:hypothetical protein K9O30_12645 [Clostridium bowmanii]|uniref:hypothetical protein n=1 Tax=Clostridium bowmanii TaxID=132925 RepID=UPI001CD530E0|nr:hypothetical protein [Clostridium bowmanii]MCA1074555.1 hypothetical protein [Clostridium bowmanii]
MNKKMPVIFIGHGSPMNAILDNSYTEAICKSIENIPKPEAILVISAHWETDGTYITADDLNRFTIFMGFNRNYTI